MINKPYIVRFLPSTEAIRRCAMVMKKDGAIYTVVMYRADSNVTCNCDGFRYRSFCKHVRNLVPMFRDLDKQKPFDSVAAGYGDYEGE